MILVTGANGFVGSALCTALARDGHPVRGAVRDRGGVAPAGNVEYVALGEIDGETHWREALSGVACVVHLAARTHAMDASDEMALPLYRRTNVDGTRRLAECAARCGVKRIVFVSSIKVNGESTAARPFTERDVPRPQDAYGITKWEAERALLRIAAESGMEAVILRPPLVYGPGVKGNLLRLMRLIDRGIPLPLASIRNRRSLLYLGNLLEAIALCVRAERAAGSTYLVSDGEDVSTAELVMRLGTALHTPARMFRFPVSLLTLGARVLGKRDEMARLTGSLQVDSTQLRTELGWRPSANLAVGLDQTARWYRRRIT